MKNLFIKQRQSFSPLKTKRGSAVQLSVRCFPLDFDLSHAPYAKCHVPSGLGQAQGIDCRSSECLSNI